MLNLIKSVVVTFISIILNDVSFCKGPILVGLVVGASIMVFANSAEASPVKGTQVEYVQAQKNVAKGIYINDAGTRVSKPTLEICHMYRNTLAHYQNKHGSDKGAMVWLTVVTRRGC